MLSCQHVQNSTFGHNHFNEHSYILYDVIVANKLLIADVNIKLNVTHISVTPTLPIREMIDHMLSTGYDADCIMNCHIIR
jgi:hypothetical protein